MKKLFLAGAALMVFGGSAMAADISRRPAYTPPPPPAPVYTWTGLYWGGNIGYSWGHAKTEATVLGLGTFSESQKIDGVIGGFQSGYNYQFGAWVWGFETDIQASGQKGGSTFPLSRLVWDSAEPPWLLGDSEHSALWNFRCRLWSGQRYFYRVRRCTCCGDRQGREGGMDRRRWHRGSVRRRVEREA